MRGLILFTLRQKIGLNPSFQNSAQGRVDDKWAVAPNFIDVVGMVGRCQHGGLISCAILSVCIMRFLAVTFCFMGLALLAGCERAPEHSANLPAKSSVTFMQFYSAASRDVIYKVAEDFTRQSAQYELKAVMLDSVAFKLRTEDIVQSEYPPDIYTHWAGAHIAAAAPWLEPLDDIWKQQKLEEKYAPNLVQALTQENGHRYMIPLIQHHVAFFYNKKVFDAHGLKPPATWTEFLAVCDALKAKGIVPIALGNKYNWPGQFWLDMLMLRTLPYEFREQLMAGKVRYDDPKVVGVFERWNDLVQRGYFTPNPNDLKWQEAADTVYKDQAGMILMASWVIGYFQNKVPKWVGGEDFDFFRFPMIDAQVPVVGLGAVDGLIVPKKASNLEGAKQALAYFSTADAQQAFSKVSGTFVPNRDVSTASYSKLQNRLAQEYDHNQLYAFHYDLSTPRAVSSLGLAAMADFLAFPKAYPQILKELSRDADQAFRHTEGKH